MLVFLVLCRRSGIMIVRFGILKAGVVTSIQLSSLVTDMNFGSTCACWYHGCDQIRMNCQPHMYDSVLFAPPFCLLSLSRCSCACRAAVLYPLCGIVCFDCTYDMHCFDRLLGQGSQIGRGAVEDANLNTSAVPAEQSVTHQVLLEQAVCLSHDNVVKWVIAAMLLSISAFSQPVACKLNRQQCLRLRPGAVRLCSAGL